MESMSRKPKLIVSVASLAGQSAAHWKMCAYLEPLSLITVEAESNVALARNRQLTAALDAPEPWEVCMLFDDDVFVSTSDAESIAIMANELGRPVSALYPTSAGDVRVQYATIEGKVILLTGLGAIAIPRTTLVDLAEHLDLITTGEGTIRPFCKSAPSPDGRFWWNEDAWLCYNLGGVVPHPTVRAEHRKSRMMRLSETAHNEALQKIQGMMG